MLEIKNLTVDFITPDNTVRAVDNLNVKIPKGKTVAIVGESGSGKSVTSLAIMRLLGSSSAQVSGEILFNGEDLLKLSEKKMRELRGNRISMIFQEPMTSLNPVYTVGDQVVEAIRLHQDISKEAAKARTIELFKQVGIPTPELKFKSYPHELSGGQKQRVMIAMAISCEPELLICDEPTTALDVTIQKQVLELLLDLQKKYKMSMMFITHDLGVVADLADDVVVMYRSQIKEHNDKLAIFNDPKHPYTRGLIACRPDLGKNPKRLLTVSDFMDEDGSPKSISQERIEVFEKDYIFKDDANVLLEIKDLKTHFPIKGGIFSRTIDHVKAVDGVSFKLEKGKTLGLVGESGCGKTTLGRTILRLIEPTAGQIIYEGKDITKFNHEEMRALRRKMQIIFQDPYSSLNPRMNIAQILMEPLQVHEIGANKKERLDMCKELMEKVGLFSHQLNRYPHEFSGGQRQRICIARALMLKPEFIICDESVSALDVSIQAQVLNLLLDLQEEFGLTYIFISHDLSVVNFISDQVAVMNQGRIVEMNSAKNIYQQPQNEYTKTLLNAIPVGIEKNFDQLLSH